MEPTPKPRPQAFPETRPRAELVPIPISDPADPLRTHVLRGTVEAAAALQAAIGAALRQGVEMGRLFRQEEEAHHAADVAELADHGRKGAPVTHRVKIHPAHLQAIREGRKAVEIRWNDRGYRVGDVLELREWIPEEKRYTGSSLLVLVTHLDTYGLAPGYVALSLGQS